MARKVLIADDSPTVQKKAGGILTGEGYEVVTVSNGVAAVKKLPTVMPSVVLVDVSMPGKDGYEVCEFVKSHETLKSVPVLLVFSQSDPIEEEKAARAHADGRIAKPFSNPEELISVVGKFAAMAEAAENEPASAPPPPRPAAPVFVIEPMDAEPELESKQALPDMSVFSSGIGIGEVAPEEHYAPAPPALEFVAEAAPGQEAAPGVEAIPSFEPVPAMEAPPPLEELSPAEVAPPIEVTPDMEEAPRVETPAEIVAPASQPIELEEPPASAEPVLVEEAAPSMPPPPVEEGTPPAERTMMFHAPAQIAEPVLSDETVEAAESPETVAAPPEAPAEPPVEAEAPVVAASTLESFSLHEAESGQVRIAGAEEAPPATEFAAPPEPVAPPEPAAPPPAVASRALDEAQIFSIVHQVVAKMSPPALSPQTVEDLARRFADEVIQDLHSRP